MVKLKRIALSGVALMMVLYICVSVMPLGIFKDTKVYAESMSDFANEVILLVNEKRAENGLAPLKTAPIINEAAGKRGEELLEVYSHDRPDGNTCFTVFGEYGITYNAAGENIASGQETPEDVMNSWMNSTMHKSNILNSEYTHIGVGVAYSGSRYYWVQCFVKTGSLDNEYTPVAALPTTTKALTMATSKATTTTKVASSTTQPTTATVTATATTTATTQQTASPTVSVGDVYGKAGETVKVPISIVDGDGFGLKNYGFKIQYDIDLLEDKTAVSPTMSISGSSNISSWLGQIDSVSFTIPEDAIAGTVYGINICDVYSYSNGSQDISDNVQTIGGSISVTTNSGIVPTVSENPIICIDDVVAEPGEKVELDINTRGCVNFLLTDFSMTYNIEKNGVSVEPSQGLGIGTSYGIRSGKICSISFEVPEDAKRGDVYNINVTKVKYSNGTEDMSDDVQIVGGSITVKLAEEKTYNDVQYIKCDDHIAIVGRSNSDLTTVHIPNAIDGLLVTEIKSYAFYNNENLYEVVIPRSVTTIEAYALGNDKAHSASLEGILSIYGEKDSVAQTYAQDNDINFIEMTGVADDGVFSYQLCYDEMGFAYYSITKCNDKDSAFIEVPMDIQGYFVKEIGSSAFENCSKLESVSLPSSIEKIGACAFQGTALKNINIPDYATIGALAFYATNLKYVTIPKNVEIIGQYAFGYDKNFNKIDGFTIYGVAGCESEAYATKNGFNFINAMDSLSNGLEYRISPDNTVSITGCDDSVTNVAVPTTISGYPVTKIDDNSFSYHQQLVSIEIPEGITYIGSEAFIGCNKLASINIPDSVTSIGIRAFDMCSSLKEINLSANVSSIGTDAFSDNINLQSINVDKDNTVYSSKDGVLFNNYQTRLICFPAGKLNTSYKIPTTVTNIEGMAFFHCENLKSVIIPNSVQIIEQSAFAFCENLKQVEIPSSVEVIGEWAFGYYGYKGPSKMESFKIYGTSNSMAEVYANDNQFTFAQISTTKGDANNDSTVNVIDLVLLSKYVINSIEISDTTVINLDITSDGKVNILDLVKLAKYLVNKDTLI